MHLLSWIKQFFRRPVKSTMERLEEIEKDILDLESTRTSSIDTEKRFIFRLFLYSFILFGISFLTIYYYYWPSSQSGRIVLWTSLLIYPLVVSGLKWIVHTFFMRNVLRADEKLKTLREEKQQLLEEVMENETFNKAQQILKRFDPLMFARLTAMESDSSPSPKSSAKYLEERYSTVRQRTAHTVDGDHCAASTPAPSSVMKNKGNVQNGVDPRTPITRSPMGSVPGKTPQPRLPRPILPRERSVVDRVLDALVGDGPDKRYALICAECAAHNGMALKEEFEFLAFRCCYCFHFNPPRRTRLRTPIPSNIIPVPLRTPAPSSKDNPTTTPPSVPTCVSSTIESSDRSLSSSPPLVPTTTSASELSTDSCLTPNETIT